MNKIFSIFLSAASILAASCCEIEDGTTDIDSWPMPMPTYEAKTYTFNHPCMLHSKSDIDYVKGHLSQSPWSDSYAKLLATAFCRTDYTPNPVKYLARLDATNWGDGGGRWDDAGLRDEYYPGIHTNCTNFYYDCHAAYQLALKYQLSGDMDAAATAVKILEAWAKENKGLLLGRNKWKDDVIDSNEYLIMFQIHQVANAAELLRNYNNWENSEGFKQVKAWLKEYFYPFCSKFIAMNNTDHWWMNWDMASMTAILSMGILLDDQDMVNEAILHFKQGEGPGCIMRKGVIAIYDDPDGTGEKLAQGNESGRDQGHNVLCASMVGTFCQMAYNIGEDLFSFEDGRAIAFAQYIAKLNMVRPEIGRDYKKENLTDASFKYSARNFPCTSYSYNGGTMTELGLSGRGEIRPCWDLWYGYCKANGIKATYIKEIADFFRPDEGSSNRSQPSGSFDQLGFTTLMNYRE
ncbi:MAG: alginate lyase family protein [Muribaculaceae bacterium]|nr:alginate lyase family protein [Muribaculaceae bacterium]